MDVKLFIEILNAQRPKPEELINFYNRFGDCLSYSEATKEINEREIIYKSSRIWANPIAELLQNTTIVGKTIAFVTFEELTFINDDCIRFAHFLELDPLYYFPFSEQIWIQKPGVYYYDDPSCIVKGFPNLTSFFNSLTFMDDLLNSSKYKNQAVLNSKFEELKEINIFSEDCYEFQDYFFENIKNFQ